MVEVKNLEWLDNGLGIRYASSAVGVYKMSQHGIWWLEDGPNRAGGEKAAQADYEQRIRSALK